jgi:hypothetical protein
MGADEEIRTPAHPKANRLAFDLWTQGRRIIVFPQSERPLCHICLKHIGQNSSFYLFKGVCCISWDIYDHKFRGGL